MQLTNRWVLGFVGTALAASTSGCPQVIGNFTINQVDLYAEGFAWNPDNCKLYLSSIYNCTLVEYDPQTESTKIIEVPGISQTGNFTSTLYHGNGIDYDASTGHVFYALASAGAFANVNGDFSNNTLTGSNQVWVYDPSVGEFVWHVDLQSLQDSFYQKTGYRTSGFQDIAEDRFGNSYAIATFANTIAKIDRATKNATLWWSAANNTDQYGLGGIFIYEDTLVTSDHVSGGLISFDLNCESPNATYVPLQGLPSDFRPATSDGLFAPDKYNGMIALWSDDSTGTSVYGSNDSWKSAHYLGLVLDPLESESGYAVATVEIGDRVFALLEYFQSVLPQKRKDSFPILDISDQLDIIVSGFL